MSAKRKPPVRKAQQPRISLDDPKVVDELCARIAEGRGVLEACADPTMPNASSVYRRMSTDEAFATRIARAREAQQDAEVERCVEMADQATPEDWQVVKLRIWARQWRAAKLSSRKYGDKVQTEISGADGGPIETVELTPREVAQRAAFLLAKGAKAK